MINPSQRNQNVSSQEPSLTHVHSHKNLSPIFQDSLRLGVSSDNTSTSFIGKIWTSFVNSIKSFFNRLFGAKSPSLNNQTQEIPSHGNSPSLKNQIQGIASRDKFVWFYKKEENPLTSFLGNFHPCTIKLWGLTFKCAEAAFQAAKFSGNRTVMQQFQNLDGEAAWRLGRQLTQNWSRQQYTHWRSQNLDVMREVEHAKYSQNPQLKELLLSTGSSLLVEHLPVKGRDAYWGDDSDGTGQNWLGRVLMETRGALGGIGPVNRNEQYDRFISY